MNDDVPEESLRVDRLPVELANGWLYEFIAPSSTFISYTQYTPR